MRRVRWMPLAVALAVTLAACGGDDDTGDSDDAAAEPSDDAAEPSDDDSQQAAATPPTPPADDASGEPAAGPSTGSDVAVPVARFAAHGPDADNTIGPGCATGVDTRGGDVFRFTPPAGWTWWGTSGGSSYDEVHVKDADDVSLYVTESAYDYDTEVISGWTIIGPTGTDVVIDGVALPIMEVSVDGDPGYAIVNFDYMSPMPALTQGASLGTVALTSAEPGRPTLAEAEQLLGSVRIERCAAVGEAMIWGPAGGVRLVPRFEPDPLGKNYPDQPQPAYEPTVTPLDSYSLEQVAYLMPVEAEIAMCAAAAAVEYGAGNPIGYLYMFTPSGTNTTDLEAIVAAC